MKKIITIFFVVILLLGIGGFVAYSWFNSQITASSCSDEEKDSAQIIQFEIEQGESVQDISVKLQQAGIISSSDVFYFYVKLNRLGSSFQAGKFAISECSSMQEVAEILQRAEGNDIAITITEGLRMDEIATVLEAEFLNEENTNFDKDEFLSIVESPDDYDFGIDILAFKPEGNSLEGFLLPETYYVQKDITTWELVNLLVTSLEDQLAEDGIDLTSHNQLSPYEVLTLASIIEREALTTDERYMIADILLKRLRGENEGVKLLETDATLLYEEKDWKAVVTIQLKEKDSPYNTYKYPGLTPTPISNPRIESIKAVMSPTENEFLFYLHDDQGQIHYAKTYDQHINNQRCHINKNPDYCL